MEAWRGADGILMFQRGIQMQMTVECDLDQARLL